MSGRACILLVFASAFAGCVETVEPQSRGRYYIDNGLDTTVYAAATMTEGTSAEFTASIPAGTRSLFLEVTEGSGGHILPSDLLSTLVLTMDSMGTLVEVYSGVHNADWDIQEPTPTRTDLVLVVE